MGFFYTDESWIMGHIEIMAFLGHKEKQAGRCLFSEKREKKCWSSF